MRDFALLCLCDLTASYVMMIQEMSQQVGVSGATTRHPSDLLRLLLRTHVSIINHRMDYYPDAMDDYRDDPSGDGFLLSASSSEVWTRLTSHPRFDACVSPSHSSLVHALIERGNGSRVRVGSAARCRVRTVVRNKYCLVQMMMPVSEMVDDDDDASLQHHLKSTGSTLTQGGPPPAATLDWFAEIYGASDSITNATAAVSIEDDLLGGMAVDWSVAAPSAAAGNGWATGATTAPAVTTTHAVDWSMAAPSAAVSASNDWATGATTAPAVTTTHAVDWSTAAPSAATGNGWATGATTAPAVTTSKTTAGSIGFPNPQPSFDPYQQQPAFHSQQSSVYPLAFNSQHPKERFR